MRRRVESRERKRRVEGKSRRGWKVGGREKNGGTRVESGELWVESERWKRERREKGGG